MLAIFAHKVNPILHEVSDSDTPVSQSSTSQLTQSVSNPYQKEPRLEVSLNWFDKWHINWSCSESTWKQLSEQLKSPLSRGIAIGTGIAIGIGATVYCYSKISNSLNPNQRPTPITAPVEKR